MKLLNLTLLLLLVALCGRAQIGAIGGPNQICLGSTGTLTDTTSGGTWSSSAGGVLTIGSSTGVATGISLGVSIVTYTVGGSYVTYPVTVNALPATITGPGSLCVGATVAEIDPMTGGTWATGSTSVATIGATTGLVTGIAAGVTTITYSIFTGCYVVRTITVDVSPSFISGSSSLCAGSTMTLSSVPGGGTWTSSTPVIATVNPASGLLTGLSAGADTIIYTLPGGCSTHRSIVVGALPTVYVVSGGGRYCVGGTGVPVYLSGSVPGVSYQLYHGTAPMGAPLAGTGAMLNFGLQTVAGVYKVVASDAVTGCMANMADSATVSISSLARYTVTGGGSYCAGSPGVHITLASSDTGISYTLYVGGIAVGSPIAGTGSSLDFGVYTGVGSYTIVGTDGTTSCVESMTGSATVAINPLPTVYAVTGGGSYCSGGTGVHVGLASSALGVNYQTYLGSTVVGSPVTGTGVSLDFGLFTPAGTYTIRATNVVTGCTDTMLGSSIVGVSALPAVHHVTGGGSYCAGGSGVVVGLDATDLGVNYQLYLGTTMVGPVVAGTGTAISFGLQTAAGTYTVMAISSTTTCTNPMSGSAIVTVSPLPTTPAVSISITGGDTVCAGTSTTFSAIIVGGGTAPAYQWYVNGTLVTGATSATYTYVPIAGDVVSVQMASSAACALPATVSASATMTVLPMATPTVVITATPGTTICTGATVLYATTETGGGATPSYSWAVNGITVPGATSATYSYAPLSGDVVMVVMTSSYMCRTASAAIHSVTMSVSVPSVTATEASAGCGGEESLTAAGASTYSWAPTTGLSCSTCATTQVWPTVSSTYTVTGTDGFGCTGTATVVADANRIFGHISYTGGTSADTFKVWLIQFDPTDSVISAVDSTASCLDGSMPYFEFLDPSAGNYMVKAKLNTSVAGTSGWAPTYSLSTPHWDSAATVTHASGNDSLPIHMVYGTVPSGPGFIGGYVVSGAGRGTSGDVPAEGMLIYLKDMSGNVLTYVLTATDGTYAFTNLAYGTYQVYPETFKYYTTPSSVVTLSAGADSSTGVNFKQHTSSGLITPYAPSKVTPVVKVGLNVQVYPNPAGDVVYLGWEQPLAGTVHIAVQDLEGRDVLNADQKVTNGAQKVRLDVGQLADGVYLIKLGGDVNYTGKLLIAH